MGKMFQNASSLKPLGQLKPNCPGMIIRRSSTNYMFFMCFLPLNVNNIILVKKKHPEALKSLYRSPGYKKNNWSYVKTMSCSGSHLGITINIKHFIKGR
jgi:hypothetical protein